MSNAIVPIPRCTLTVRPATVGDIQFMDDLQKLHQPMLGWTPRQTFEGKIAAGHVLVAEDEHKKQLGYCISQDRYMGRDDVGVFYQVNVAPVMHRKLIGATLVKTVFERAAYGCRLFCCWCAQDIAANYFWESIGFIPMAFRTGNRIKQRIHIFWQRRIREGDTTTPFWFPSETRGGMMNEARLVLPIPPGIHWRDVMPVVLPGMQQAQPEQKTLPPTRPPASGKKFVPKTVVASAPPPPPKHLKVVPEGMAAVVTASGIKYVQRGDYVPPPVPPKPKRERKPSAKNDPKMVAAARECRDRFLEDFNSGRFLPSDATKYEVSRSLPERQSTATPTPLLPDQAAPLRRLPEAA